MIIVNENNNIYIIRSVEWCYSDMNENSKVMD
jgi:hypothetical protein